jgi:adenylate cyclase
MPTNPNKLSQFWQELKRRNVVRVITVYAAAAFVTLELVSIIVDPLRLPDWTLSFVIVLLCIGFIIAVILSWIYDIKPEEDLDKKKSVQKEKPKEKQVASNSWKIASYISFVVIVALIVLNIIPRNNHSKEIELTDKSIAVLPFKNDSPDSGNEYFINGTMEAILDNLCKIEDLKVVGRTSSEQYRNIPKPIPVIAEELNVSYILEGSGQKYGNRIKLTVQLLDARNDRHLWSSPYTREIVIEDIFILQSEIAQLVAEEIKAIITPEEKQRINKIPTENIEAYEEFLLGKHYYHKHTKGGFEEGIKHFNRAIQLDSTFAPAYVYLSFTYQFMARYNWIDPDDYYEEAKESTTKSLSLDNSAGLSHAASGMFKIIFEWDIYGPDEDFQKAIRLNPNSSEIYALYAQYLRWLCRYEEGIEISKKAIELDPVDPYTNLWLETNYFYAGYYDKAIDHLKKMFLIDSTFVWTYIHMAHNYTLKGDSVNALTYADKAMSIGDTRINPLLASTVAWVYAKSGKQEEAQEILAHFQNSSVDAFNIAFIYYGLGESEKAIDLLYKAYEEGSRSILYLKAMSDSYFKDLKENPRYIYLLDKIGF